MKQFLLFSLFTFLTVGVFAQELSVEPNPANFDKEGLDLNDDFLEVVNHSELNNLSGSEVQLRWRKVVVSAPSAWQFPVCDNNQCYFHTIFVSPAEVVIAANDLSLFDVHCRPNNVSGCGTVQLEVAAWDDEEFANILYTSTYEFKVNNAGECLTSVNNVVISQVRVYPNPTTNLFQIAELANIPEADEVAVYNVLGKQVKSFSTAQSEFSVGDLPDGMYLVSIISKQDGILKTVRMSKSAVRP